MVFRSYSRPIFLCSFLMVCYSSTQSASQAQNLLVNGSFEQGDFVANGQNTMSLPLGSTVMTGWTTLNAELAWIKDPNPFPGVMASDGSFSLDLSGYHDSSPYGGVQQTLTTTTNKRYTLSFDLGGQQNFNGDFSITASAGNASQTFTYNPFLGGTNYGNFSMDFTALGNSTAVTLVGTASASGNYIGLDHVSVVKVAAPAPGSLLTMLLGIGMGGMGFVLRRRTQEG